MVHVICLGKWARNAGGDCTTTAFQPRFGLQKRRRTAGWSHAHAQQHTVRPKKL